MAKAKTNTLPQTTKEWLIFLMLTGLIGYALGTLLLLGPLRNVLEFLRTNNYSAGLEKAVVIGLIGVLIAVTLLVGLYAFKQFKAAAKSSTKLIIFTIPLVLAIVAVCFLLNPGYLNKGEKKQVVGERFTIGPYPEKEQIKQLKEEGYAGIITLLHPAVAPFEPKLLADEEKNAAAVGLELVKAPMLPWLSDNTESIAKIKQLVNTGKGRYYIHCYLGKDRVNVVKNLILRVSDKTTISSTLPHRTFEEVGVFERGSIYKIAEDIYFVPYPTKEEFLGYILSANYKTVVNMLGNDTEDSKKTSDNEIALLKNYEMPLVNIPLKDNADSKSIASVVNEILKLPRPLVIHHWNTSSPLSKQLLEEFKRKNQSVTNLSEQ